MQRLRIKFKESCAGIHFAYKVGEVVDLDVKLAKSLITAGYAEITKEETLENFPKAIPVFKAAIIETPRIIIAPKAKAKRTRRKKKK